MIHLSKRLTALASLVPDRGILADIGTDHGYIPIALCQQDRISRAIAMDINPGPLARAQEHIRENGLEQKIETRISDGLAALIPGEADTILIAGMGGALMQRILSDGMDTARRASCLILQPQSELVGFRQFLRQQGFQILAEDMVLEDGKYYPMMTAFWKGSAAEEIPEQDLYDLCGELLLKGQHPVLRQWLDRELMVTERILKQLRQQESGENIRNRIAEMEDKRQRLIRCREYFHEEDVFS